MTSIDVGHFEIGRRIELGIRSMVRSTLTYGCVAIVGAVALTAVEVGTRIAPVTISIKDVPVKELPIEELPVREQPVPAPAPDVSASREPIPSVDMSVATPAPVMVSSPASSLATSPAFSAVTFPAALELPASSAFLIRAAQVKRPVASLVEWTALAWDGDAFADPFMSLVAQEDALRDIMRMAGGLYIPTAALKAGNAASLGETAVAFDSLVWATGTGQVASHAMSKAALFDGTPRMLDFMQGVTQPVGTDAFHRTTTSGSFVVGK